MNQDIKTHLLALGPVNPSEVQAEIGLLYDSVMARRFAHEHRRVIADAIFGPAGVGVMLDGKRIDPENYLLHDE